MPDWIDPTTWADYLEMRRTIRKPATKRAKELTVEKLQRLRAGGDDPDAVLKKSIEMSWQGVFSIKDDGRFGRAAAPPPSPVYVPSPEPSPEERAEAVEFLRRKEEATARGEKYTYEQFKKEAHGAEKSPA